MTADLAMAGQNALEQSGTYPAHGYVDGALYQFTVQGGALVAQLCGGSGVLGDSDGLSDRAEVLISSAPFDELADQLRYVLSRYDTTLPPQDVELLRARYNRAIGRHAYTHRAEGVVGDDGDLAPFLPSGFLRALGLPPPEAAKILSALGYAATMTGIRLFQTAANIPATGIVDAATMVALHAAMSVAGLSDPPVAVRPKPEPTGTPLYELGGKIVGDALRAVSREFEREIKSVSGSVSEPWQPDPTGTSVKSLETPGYLRDPPEPPSIHDPSPYELPVVVHPATPRTAPVDTPPLDPERYPAFPTFG